ncbi:MAG: suppressor of fused domain protein [Treponema sp.]|nr:suppressor of fused domain protein [Treponema sp.]
MTSLLEQIKQWHDGDEHQAIVNAIDKIPRPEWDYNLSCYYARALNNLERYQEALDILSEQKEKGKEDGLWYFRMGYALYYLCREAEAAEYFQKAVDYGDSSEDTLEFLRTSREEAEQKNNEEPEEAMAPEMYSQEEIDALENHIGAYFGKFDKVFHEIVSPDIHVDIAIIEPTPERDYYVLCTMGMGAHCMNVPPDCTELERAEILVCLPRGWNLDKTDEEIWYWPLRWLKLLARLPIEENTWLGWGHTVPNGKPFADNTELTTVLLLNPGAFAEAGRTCTLPGGETVNIYQMIPLYEEEAQFKIKYKAEKLLSLLENEALEYVKPDRPSVVPRLSKFI